MKDGKYSVMIVEDQQMPKALFSHFVESSDKFYLQVAIENASVADIVCTRTPVDLILMDVVTENGESGLEAAAKIKATIVPTKLGTDGHSCDANATVTGAMKAKESGARTEARTSKRSAKG